MTTTPLQVALLALFLLVALTSCKSGGYFEATDFTAEGLFTSGIEAPVVDAQGNIYAVNFERQGTVGKLSPQGEVSLFVQLPEGSVGNGLCFNRKGDLLVADYTGHNILQVDTATRQISVFVHEDDMNQPNDIAITHDDYLFASDPCWSDSTGKLWLISPLGETRLMEENMGTTNGIALSPDGSRLYVNESRQLNLWVYDLSPDKNLSRKRLFYRFKGYGLDGMYCDSSGKLYVCRHEKGTVAILSPDGKLLREVRLRGSKPSNIALHNGIAYLTLQDRGCLETFRFDPNP